MLYIPEVFAAVIAGLILGRRREFITKNIEEARKEMESCRYTEAVMLINALATPDIAELHWIRGQAYERTGHTDLAQKEYAHAKELGWDSSKLIVTINPFEPR